MAETRLQIEAAAAARVDELGLRKEFEKMIEHARQTAPGLRGIRATLEQSPECVQEGPQVVIWVHREEPADPLARDRTDWNWSGWRAQEFPPAVCWEIKMISVYGGPNGW
jgi:hypothetical protein